MMPSRLHIIVGGEVLCLLGAWSLPQAQKHMYIGATSIRMLYIEALHGRLLLMLFYVTYRHFKQQCIIAL